MALEAGRKSSAREDAITPFVIAAYATGYLALIAGWMKGGHPERFGAAALICDALFTAIVHGSAVAAPAAAASTFAATLVVLWLALRSGRWWPFVAGASMVLSALVSVLRWGGAGLSEHAAESAHVGLWILIYLALLAGVAERWMAGEAPVSRIGRVAPGVSP